VGSAVVALLIAIVVVVIAIVVVLRLLLAELARVSALREAQARNAIERPSVNRALAKAGVSGVPGTVTAGAMRQAQLEEEASALAERGAAVAEREQQLESRADQLEAFAARLEAKAIEIETKGGEGLVPATVDAPRHVRTRDILKLHPTSGWRKVRSAVSLLAMVTLLGLTAAGLFGTLVLLVAVALERTLN
jgi:hypothetical protein